MMLFFSVFMFSLDNFIHTKDSINTNMQTIPRSNLHLLAPLFPHRAPHPVAGSVTNHGFFVRAKVLHSVNDLAIL